jgi:hypothetical protein
MRILKEDCRWFDVPNDPDNGRVKIKHLTPAELSEINDKSFQKKINYKSGKGKKEGYEPEVDITENPKVFRELPIKMAVVAWENFFDKNDKPMECTPENIERAIRQIDGFVIMVVNAKAKLADDIAQEKKDQLKNLKGSAGEPVK